MTQISKILRKFRELEEVFESEFNIKIKINNESDFIAYKQKFDAYCSSEEYNMEN